MPGVRESKKGGGGVRVVDCKLHADRMRMQGKLFGGDKKRAICERCFTEAVFTEGHFVPLRFQSHTTDGWCCPTNFSARPARKERRRTAPGRMGNDE